MNHLKYQGCIVSCTDCAIECSRCEYDCLNEDNASLLVKCLKLTRDCADFCFLAVRAMASNSEFVKEICSLCAEICISCANECEKQSHIYNCLECEAKCRMCAIECHKMSIM